MSSSTALLPIIHHRLQVASKKNADVGATAREIIRDAVVNGDLLVSDATAVVNDVRGMPMPLVLSRPKTEGNDETETKLYKFILTKKKILFF